MTAGIGAGGWAECRCRHRIINRADHGHIRIVAGNLSKALVLKAGKSITVNPENDIAGILQNVDARERHGVGIARPTGTNRIIGGHRHIRAVVGAVFKHGGGRRMCVLLIGHIGNLRNGKAVADCRPDGELEIAARRHCGSEAGGGPTG